MTTLKDILTKALTLSGEKPHEWWLALGSKTVYDAEPSMRAPFGMEYVPVTEYDAFARSALPLLAKICQEQEKALEQIDIEWCQHPGMPKADEFRQWCTACSEWIYPNETNPAREAQANIAKLIEGAGL